MRYIFPLFAIVILLASNAYAQEAVQRPPPRDNCEYVIEEGQETEKVTGTVTKSEIMYPNIKCKNDDCTEMWKAVKSMRLIVLDREMPDGSIKQFIAHPPRQIINDMIEEGSLMEVGERYSFCAYRRKYDDPWQQKTFGDRLNIDIRTIRKREALQPSE